MAESENWMPRVVLLQLVLSACVCTSVIGQTPPVSQDGSSTGAPTTSAQPQTVETNTDHALAALINGEISSGETPKGKFEGSIWNDVNKELIDYGDELIGSLDFIQTLKLPDGQTRVDSMLAKHHSEQELYEYLSELNRQYPDLTRLYSIGESVEGRKLWVLELSESPGKRHKLKPQFRYIANMHGNEPVGRELSLHLARLLLENYRAALEEPAELSSKSTGPKFVRKLLRDTSIHILPSLNPDGYARSEVGCTYEMPSRRGRVNANNVDLNRNFPNAQLGFQVDPSTQPETLAIIEWSKRENFVLSSNLHSGALVALSPYGYAKSQHNQTEHEPNLTPDDDVFRSITKVYSTSHKTMSLGQDCYDRCSNYHPEHKFPDGISNSAEWYSYQGGIADWIYDSTNEFPITIELGCNQYPLASSLPQYWDYNKKALVKLIREVHKGLKGQLTDAETGQPLANVTVRVQGREGHDIKSDANGEYFRLLLPGTYEVSFERADLKPQKATVLISHPGMPQIHNLKMSRRDGVAPTPTPSGGGENEHPHEAPSFDGDAENNDHSLLVASLVMSVITLAMLILLAGAYVIQKQRLRRSQSVSVELQPRSASTGISLGGKSSLGTGSVAGAGSSTNRTHLEA